MSLQGGRATPAGGSVRTPSIFRPSPLSQVPTRFRLRPLPLAGGEIDPDVFAAGPRFRRNEEMTLVLPAVVGKGKDRREMGRGRPLRAVMVEQDRRPRPAVPERDDREVEDV